MSGHVVIIGGGIVGLCSAFYLSEWGWKVTVLEQGSFADPGASHGNSGFIVPSHFTPLASPGMVGLGLRMMMNPASPFGVKYASAGIDSWLIRFMRAATADHVRRVSPLIRDLNLESRRLYQVMGRDLAWADMPIQKGMLMIASKKETVSELHHLVEIAADHGLTAEKLDDLGVKRKAEAVEIRSPGGCYFDCDAHLNPGVVMDRLVRFLRARGVTLMEEAPVTRLIKSGHRLRAVVCDGERISADEFVLAAGVWSGRLAEQLRLKLPLVPGKGQHMHLQKSPVQIETPMLLEDARVAVTPLGEGVRFGGTMELGAWSTKINRIKLGGMKKSIGEILPQFGRGVLEPAETWAGLRPCLPDGLPAIGRIHDIENVFLATGHAMMGMSLGPITGLIVAECLSGVKPTVPIGALNPGRFSK
jgi:D-amino-acid dehydrogenase